MRWQDDAIVLGVRSYGEKNAILEVITRHYGRHLGFVRSGQSRRMQAVLQAGNVIRINWYARLAQDLGEFRLEIIDQRFTKLIDSSICLYGLQTMIVLLRFLPERDPCPEIYRMFNVFLDHLKMPDISGKLFVQIELILLKNLGFGLELTKCVVTGVNHDLAWVSPKSGCAVCRKVGLPYADKMLVLPSFLCSEKEQKIDIDSLKSAFQLTDYFLKKYARQNDIVDYGKFRTSFLNKLLELL
ncbi:DNA repair protein RecO [Liberibacter sp. Z1]|nr:DNA repair protein RecO [Candidatus Liberibacter sp.]